MKQINILITAIGGDIGANIANILYEQNKRFNIFGTDINEKVFNINKVKKFYKVDACENSNYLNQILKIVKDHSIEIIIPVSEKEILWFNKNRNIFDDLNIKLIINSENTINTFLNKLETSSALNKLLVDTPQTYLLSSFKNQISFPLVLKAISSVQTKDIYFLKEQNQLDYLKCSINNHNDYIIQKNIGSVDEEYTTTVYRSDQKLEVISFQRKLSAGMTSFATISNDKMLKDHAKKIAVSFNLHGSINIQSRKVDNKFYIFEINPRISSTVYIRNHFGFHDLLWWIEDTLNIVLLKSQQIHVDLVGTAILGYQYKFFKEE